MIGLEFVRIEREQFAHQDGQRPAVHQDVMAGEHEPVLVGRKPDQREADERRRGEIEALGAVLRQDIVEAPCTRRFVQHREIDIGPVRYGVRHDDLHGPAEPGVAEAGAQAGMALQQCARGPRQGLAVECAGEAERELDRIDVGRLRVIVRVEQQALPAAAPAAGCRRCADTAARARRSRPGSASAAAGRSACGRPRRAHAHDPPAR